MHQSRPPRFSVVMPVWNRAALVGRAVDSVLAQTCDDLELLVVDDGSDDDIEGAMAPYREHRSVRFLRRPHRGVSAARNAGLEAARGSLVAYLDSDNRWRPEYLERMAEAFDRDGARVAYSDLNIFETRRLTGTIRFTERYEADFAFSRLLDDNLIDINSLVHERALAAAVGGWDEQLERMNDWDFILRLTAAVEPVHVKEPLVDYYFRTTTNTITATRRAMPAGLRIEEKHMGLRKPNITHDTITYTWDRLPEAKYYNWVRSTRHVADPDGGRPACLPCVIQLEPSNHCNLACTLCPAGTDALGRERRHMTLDEFRRIVDDAQEYLMLLVLWEWGEPFLNPALPEMIAYASERDIRTVTSTNAQLLGDRDYLERVLRSGLSTLIVAIDSLDEESYRAYRKRGNLGKAIAGLESLVALKKKLRSKTLIHLRMVVMKHNEHEIKDIERMGRKVGVDCFSIKTVNPGPDPAASDADSVPVDPRNRRFVYREGTYERIPHHTPCDRVWMMTNVLADGTVVPCCVDYDGAMAVGNAFEQSLTEIWNSENYAELRRKVLLDRDTLPHCPECSLNFKMARAGDWYVDRVDFNMPAMSTVQYKLRKLLRNDVTYRLWRLVRSQLRPFVR